MRSVRSAAAAAVCLLTLVIAARAGPWLASSVGASSSAATVILPESGYTVRKMETHLEHAPPRPRDPIERFDGEYGLWVDETSDSLMVHWITSDAVQGLLRVHQDGAELAEVVTPAGRGHRASIPRSGARELVLEYGTRPPSSERHTTAIRLTSGQERAPFALSRVDSIFVASDLHGEFDRFRSLLRNAGLADERLEWTGGRSHLVIAGDIFDRGPDVIPILWTLYRLEAEASRAGGGVHVLLGNHEIMVMLNDLRYVGAKEMAVAEHHGVPYWRMFDGRRSVLGRWLASRPALLRIDRVLLAHGGVSTDYLRYTVQTFADTLAAYIGHDLFNLWNEPGASVGIEAGRDDRWMDFFWGENSVFWYRGYVMSDALDAPLRRVLSRMRADLHVVGHTPVPTIHARYDGRLIPVNTVEFATEMLLLVRDGRSYRRYRYGLEGGPQAF